MNPSISSEITQIEQHLNELDFDKRQQVIDAYSRVVDKFQKWMLHLSFKRSPIKPNPDNKLNEDEQAIISFEYVYNQISPSMYFYQIKNLPFVQGFDLISLLMINFKYMGIMFSDLPIVYQTVFDRIEISLVWYDDKLKLKLEEFYIRNIKLLQLSSEYLKLNILPVSLLKSEDFSNVVKNSHKIRVLVEKVNSEINIQEKLLKKPFPLKEFFKINNEVIKMLSFSLELIKPHYLLSDLNLESSSQENYSAVWL